MRFKVRHVAFIGEVAVERPDDVGIWSDRTGVSGHPECDCFMSQRLYSFGGSYKYMLAGS
jgi:hypothetical protein